MDKKVLFVNNNLKIGGIQKALVNQLKVIGEDYDVTLLCFGAMDRLLGELPKNVKIIKAKSLYRLLAISQSEAKGIDKILRAVFAVVTKIFGFKTAIKLIGLSQKKIGEFDVAISYQQCAMPKSFYGGSAEFVLKHIDAKKKVCFIHCDYLNSGTHCKYNDKLYSRFDSIACVSDSVRKRFVSILPALSSKTVTVRNCVDEDELRKLANENEYVYDKSFINLLTVARLSHEKGIERVINAIHTSARKDLRFYIVGDGPEKPSISRLIERLGLQDSVIFLGEQSNPYRFMKNADWLLVPSYHEAAPMVFQEAIALGLKIITTETLSAREMVDEAYGVVCENSDEGIAKVICKL